MIDGGAGFGNGHLLPAGPLRESVARAAARCRAAVIIGADATGAGAQLPPVMPVLRARMAAGPAMSALAGHPALAFAGIGRPEKFFATLEDAGLILAGRAAFPDHHRYTARDLALLRRRAAAAQAMLVTTTKDFARLAARDRPGIVPLAAAIVWDDEPAFEALLKEWVP